MIHQAVAPNPDETMKRYGSNRVLESPFVSSPDSSSHAGASAHWSRSVRHPRDARIKSFSALPSCEFYQIPQIDHKEPADFCPCS